MSGRRRGRRTHISTGRSSTGPSRTGPSGSGQGWTGAQPLALDATSRRGPDSEGQAAGPVATFPDLPQPAMTAAVPQTARQFIPHLTEEPPPEPPRLWMSLSMLALFVASGLAIGSNYVLGYEPPGGDVPSVAVAAFEGPDSDAPLQSEPAVPVALPEPERDESTYQRSWNWQYSAPTQPSDETREESVEEGLDGAGDDGTSLPEIPDLEMPEAELPDDGQPDGGDPGDGLPEPEEPAPSPPTPDASPDAFDD